MARRERTGEGEDSAVRALDVDGVRTTAIITVLWAVAFVVLVFRRDELESAGRGWWMWTCLAGVGLGLLGIEYCRKRRDAIARAELDAEADADLDEATDWQEGDLAALVAEADEDGAGVPHQDHGSGEHYPAQTQYGPGTAAAEPAYPSAPDETAQHYPGGPPSRLPDDTQHHYPPEAHPYQGDPSPLGPRPGGRLPDEPRPPAPQESPQYSPSGRPPPGYVTGEFPAVAPPPAVQPQQPEQRPAQPPAAQPWPGADRQPPVHPDVAEVASPAGYSPEPDRVRRHPRDEEIARRYTEQRAPQAPQPDFLTGDAAQGGPPADPPGTEPAGYESDAYAEPERYDEGAPDHSSDYGSESSPGYASGAEDSELLSEFFGDEPVQRPSTGPDFLLDESDEPDEPDEGEYRGRRARRD